MTVIADPKSEFIMLMEFIQSKYGGCPRFNDYEWSEFSLERKEQYFVVLRMALDHCLKKPDISEQGIEYLYSEYMTVFEFLVNTESRLSNAVSKGIHAYFMGDRPEVVAAFKQLIRQPTEVK